MASHHEIQRAGRALSAAGVVCLLLAAYGLARGVVVTDWNSTVSIAAFAAVTLGLSVTPPLVAGISLIAVAHRPRTGEIPVGLRAAWIAALIIAAAWAGFLVGMPPVG